ncbi:hypothetical protein BKA56DRAFT_583673 [Ilyonectria sp. MPI-CAGE-AT-0026]|nr:hypothetical protein BKA56DRAFT_583673 [Ilyonectria sp. MPI-CAGE-AT-0026]
MSHFQTKNTQKNAYSLCFLLVIISVAVGKEGQPSNSASRAFLTTLGYMAGPSYAAPKSLPDEPIDLRYPKSAFVSQYADRETRRWPTSQPQLKNESSCCKDQDSLCDR